MRLTCLTLLLGWLAPLHAQQTGLSFVLDAPHGHTSEWRMHDLRQMDRVRLRLVLTPATTGSTRASFAVRLEGAGDTAVALVVAQRSAGGPARVTLAASGAAGQPQPLVTSPAGDTLDLELAWRTHGVVARAGAVEARLPMDWVPQSLRLVATGARFRGIDMVVDRAPEGHAEDLPRLDSAQVEALLADRWRALERDTAIAPLLDAATANLANPWDVIDAADFGHLDDARMRDVLRVFARMMETLDEAQCASLWTLDDDMHAMFTLLDSATATSWADLMVDLVRSSLRADGAPPAPPRAEDLYPAVVSTFTPDEMARFLAWAQGIDAAPEAMPPCWVVRLLMRGGLTLGPDDQARFMRAILAGGR